MNDRKQVEELIREHGGGLVRSRKHRVYRFPDGRIFTISSTPSDTARAEKNNLAELRNFLHIRRAKTGDPAAATPHKSTRRSLRSFTVPPPLPCLPVFLERCPRTPLFAILLHLFPLRERRHRP